jgi:hypothetical protein
VTSFSRASRSSTWSRWPIERSRRLQKGTSIRYVRALDHKDLALFALILAVCAFFLGNGAFASVRARRSELGALATLGWSPGEAFRIVLAGLAVPEVLAAE